MLKKIFNKKSDEEKLIELCDRSSIWSRNSFSLKRILRNNPRLNIDYLDELGLSALHYAILNNYKKAVNILLKNGINASLLDREGDNPVELAIKLSKKYHKNAQSIIIKLLKFGAFINLTTFKKIVREFGYDKSIMRNIFTLPRIKNKLNDPDLITDNLIKQVDEDIFFNKKEVDLLSALKTNSTNKNRSRNTKSLSQIIKYFHDTKRKGSYEPQDQ